MKRFPFYIFLLLAIISCKEQKAKNTNPQTTNNIPTETVIDSTDLFYFVLPENKKNAPVIFFIDSQGDGKKPIKKYETFALKNDIIIIGLTNVRNNQSVFIQEIEHAVLSARQKLNIAPEQKTYLAGFSGGARMAYYSSITKKVDGVLMCGAGPGNLNIDRLQNPLAIITGTRDFNFVESYYPPGSGFAWKEKRIISLHFRGKHEWPPIDVFTTGMEFLFQKSGVAIGNNVDYLDLAIEKEKSFDVLEAFKLIETGYKTCDESMQNEYITKMRKFSSDKIYKNYFYKLNNTLLQESQRNNTLIEALQTKDLNWWENKYKELINQIENPSDQITSDSYSRTKALLGVVLFSKTNHAIKKPLADQTIQKFLRIYELFEPDNPDVYYFEALYNYNLKKEYQPDLLKAVELGFSDKERLATDFNDSIANSLF